MDTNQNRRLRLTAAALLMAVLAACGNKGPLVQADAPEADAEAAAPVATDAPVPADAGADPETAPPATEDATNPPPPTDDAVPVQEDDPPEGDGAP